MSQGGRSFCEIIHDSNPHKLPRPLRTHVCVGNFRLKCINEKWALRTKQFNHIARKTLQFSSHYFGYYPHFLRAIIGTYQFSLFWFSVIYFLSRIVGYKFGMVRTPLCPEYHPRRLHSGRSYRRGTRYAKNWHRKKRNIKQKKTTRQLDKNLFHQHSLLF